jgi:hypothetical protein
MMMIELELSDSQIDEMLDRLEARRRRRVLEAESHADPQGFCQRLEDKLFDAEVDEIRRLQEADAAG